MQFDQEKLATLVYWIRERESIRNLKEAGRSRPWTADPILHEWRFCNVNRCDDTVTRWIFKNVIDAHATSPTLWFNLVIARLVNWPETLVKLGYVNTWDGHDFVATISGIPGKVWTGAYMIPGGPSGVDKSTYLADNTLTPLWKARDKAPVGGTCSQWFAFIESAKAMGGFLANQVVTDMKYAPVLSRASDWGTFCVAGPGTQRGLNRLFGRPLKQVWKREEAQAALIEVRRAVVAELPAMSETMRDLNNLANCFCEYDKYLRVRNGEGKPRSRYVPAEATASGTSPAEAVSRFTRSQVVVR